MQDVNLSLTSRDGFANLPVDVACRLSTTVNGDGQWETLISRSGQSWFPNMPNADRCRRRFADHEIFSQCLAERDLLRRNRDKIFGFGDHQRLETITIPHISQSVARSSQVAKRPIEVFQGRSMGRFAT